MKKIMNKFGFALICMMVAIPAFAAQEYCELINKIGGILYYLRIAAFVGAAFYVASWAWELIVKADGKIMDAVKSKGLSLLVGFLLLMMVGAIISFVMSMSGFTECKDAIIGIGNSPIDMTK